jgi:DNA helicase-2/ATP-dependent DNA helicase PcrA
LIETDELKPQARATVRRLLADFDRWRSRIDTMPHAELAQVVLDESGYTAMWQADRSADAPGRLENLKELVRALGEFASLGEFLEHVSLVMENDRSEAADMVNMMTLHAAKGLEFETVFLPGWEEGVFPNQRTMDEGGAAAIEEERRLAHVGITRAKRRCAISFAANRRTYAKWEVQAPSRFIDELPAAHIERQGAPPPSTGLSDVNHGTFAYAAPWLARERHGAGARKREGRLVDGSVNRMAAAASAASSADPASGFRAGQRVFHEKFGYGRVLTVEDNKLSIAFDKAGEKKVIDAFVQRA